MSTKIFKSTFLTSMVVLVLGFLMIFSVLINYFEVQIFAELESETQYISYGIKDGMEDFLKSFEHEKKRITIVAPDGTVLADTKSDVSGLENHSDRKEIKEALENGSGKDKRYSSTLLETTLYYAKKLDDGNVLRVSATQNSVVVILLGLMQPIIYVVAIALGISFVLSLRVSNSIVKPINSIDLDNVENMQTYEELNPLLKKLELQKKTISEQIKEAEKSREEFKLICENMSEGFLVIDKNENVLSYNNAALRQMGVQNVNDASMLSFNRTQTFREVVKKALNGVREERDLQIDAKTYNLIANPVNMEGKTIGAVIVIIDITESAKREQLRREFTSNVSHELKTPLTSISGFAEIMKLGNVDGETVKDFSNSIYDEAQRLITLVGDIMKVSELDEGNTMSGAEKCDVYSISKSVVQRLKPIAEKNGVKLKLIGDSACVWGVEKILNEMIYNLCDNAIKYNKCGGTADVIVTPTNNCVKLMVRDTGIGIPKNEQERVFERFYRVDKSRSKAVGGTGLGLAIVKHGAMFHNAKVGIESAENEGTIVTIEFVKY